MNLDNNLLVSIVVPSYNHKKYIKETILSILNQTYKNIELIVIDDGSSDGSIELLQDLQKNYSFQLIVRENKGLIKTLNEGLNLANGKYFCVVASDDIFLSNKIEVQVALMEKNTQYAFCFSKMNIIDDNSKFVKHLKAKHAQSGDVFYKLYARNFVTAPSVMLRRDILLEMGGYSDQFKVEDYPLWLKISKKYKVGFINEYLVNYRIHGQNMSSRMYAMIKETEKILDYYNIDKKTQKSLNKMYARWFYDVAKHDNLEMTYYYMSKAFASSFYKFKYLKGVTRYLIRKYFH
jgi:glycosyltransferase involved in cell wall biosynthesis